MTLYMCRTGHARTVCMLVISYILQSTPDMFDAAPKCVCLESCTDVRCSASECVLWVLMIARYIWGV